MISTGGPTDGKELILVDKYVIKALVHIYRVRCAFSIRRYLISESIQWRSDIITIECTVIVALGAWRRAILYFFHAEKLSRWLSYLITKKTTWIFSTSSYYLNYCSTVIVNSYKKSCLRSL